MLMAVIASTAVVGPQQSASAETGDCVTVAGKGGVKRNGSARVCLRTWTVRDGRQYAKLRVRQDERSSGERVFVRYRFVDDDATPGGFRRLGPSSHKATLFARTKSVASTSMDGVQVRLCYDRRNSPDRCFRKKVLRGTPPSSPATPGPEVHVVHAVPAGADPVSGIVAAIRHEIGLIDRWYRAQTKGFGPRWDRTTSGDVRVQTVSLSLTRRQIEAASAAVITDSIISTLRLGTDELAVVYLDAAAIACGYSQGQVAVMMMRTCSIYPQTTTIAFPYGATYLVAHELTHAMGAVPACAPNYIPGGHVGNDNRDLLYEGGPRDWSNLRLDPGRDDYYGHGRSDCPDIADHPIWTP
jgi:hypothetical protein